MMQYTRSSIINCEPDSSVLFENPLDQGILHAALERVQLPEGFHLQDPFIGLLPVPQPLEAGIIVVSILLVVLIQDFRNVLDPGSAGQLHDRVLQGVIGNGVQPLSRPVQVVAERDAVQEFHSPRTHGADEVVTLPPVVGHQAFDALQVLGRAIGIQVGLIVAVHDPPVGVPLVDGVDEREHEPANELIVPIHQHLDLPRITVLECRMQYVIGDVVPLQVLNESDSAPVETPVLHVLHGYLQVAII